MPPALNRRHCSSDGYKRPPEEFVIVLPIQQTCYRIMKLFTFVTVLAMAISCAIGQTIELGYPTNNAVLKRGTSFAAQVILPVCPEDTIQRFFLHYGVLQGSLEYTYQIGIALSVNSCNNGACPQPTDGLGAVLYNGAWTPTAHPQGGFYQNFTVQIPTYLSAGPAVFMLTHAGAIAVRRPAIFIGSS